MKKLYVLFLAIVLTFVFTVPVFALENIFGGYWRTRAYTEKDYSGDSSKALDIQQVDTRTRLFYTAKFNDNFKFVNKFEFNNTWGDQDGGDIGADATDIFRVKNSYADFTVGQVNLKIGTQGITLNRGFLFDDDFSGAVVTYNVSKDIAIPFVWMKAYEGGQGRDMNDEDVDFYAIYPQIKAGGATIAPIFLWTTSKDSVGFTGEAAYDKWNVYYFGGDVDAKAGPADVWFTGLYEFGTIKGFGATDNVDVSAYLLAAGFSADVEALNVHGQAFYVSGDSDDTDNDYEAFFVPAGQSYDWAAIMGGNGIFDNQNSVGSPGATPSNVMAVQLGATVKPMPKLSLTGDLWWAQLAEDNAYGDKDLGTEIDLTATYSIMDNLNLDVVAAYLMAGDATSSDGNNTDDPMLLGTRISLSF
ncbi:MAG: hypothetical protein ABFD70_13205 [Syntrophaceae bacterium]|nr:hypothetical protein [Deltaproteobacteria bacterium]